MCFVEAKGTSRGPLTVQRSLWYAWNDSKSWCLACRRTDGARATRSRPAPGPAPRSRPGLMGGARWVTWFSLRDAILRCRFWCRRTRLSNPSNKHLLILHPFRHTFVYIAPFRHRFIDEASFKDIYRALQRHESRFKTKCFKTIIKRQ